MTCNLLNGFLQRLESFRKYAFGVHGVYGEEPSLEIRGVWVWRGLDHPMELKEHPSYDYN
jgi:elongation factor 1-gamma